MLRIDNLNLPDEGRSGHDRSADKYPQSAASGRGMMSDAKGGAGERLAQEWREIARVGDVPENDVIQVNVGDLCLALFNLGGRYYATSGICTHARAPLAQGYVQDDTIECPLHQGVFHIPTGRAMTPPATRDLKVFPVKLEGDRILLCL